ncbi:hypothetical protein PRIEUP_LOCUS5996 [Pristimantis euphronides]
MIAQGSKPLCVTLPDLRIRLIDLLNFIPMKLSKIPQAMRVSGAKGNFLHFFNTAENQNYVGPLPDVKYYDVEYMTVSERKEFMTWYDAEKNSIFDLEKELKLYCKQDVGVLRHCCIPYHERIMEMIEKKSRVYCKCEKKFVEKLSCIDPFQLIPLGFVCMAIYHIKFLHENTIAILPSDNYHKTQKRYSTLAIQWLMYIALVENIDIQHTLRRGEEKVAHYFLDGYACITGKATAFEFYGCFYHCCCTGSCITL